MKDNYWRTYHSIPEFPGGGLVEDNHVKDYHDVGADDREQSSVWNIRRFWQIWELGTLKLTEAIWHLHVQFWNDVGHSGNIQFIQFRRSGLTEHWEEAMKTMEILQVLKTINLLYGCQDKTESHLIYHSNLVSFVLISLLSHQTRVVLHRLYSPVGTCSKTGRSLTTGR